MPSLDTADRPLTQKRSMSAGATRRNLGLSVMTTFTTTPKKRVKRLVLGPGEDVPGGDQVNLSPEPLRAGERIAVKRGKKMTNKAQQESTDVRKQRMLVKRKHPSRTTEMLQHCDAEHEFDVREVPPPAIDTGSSRRQMAKEISQTTITRKEGDPLGLTIDENLVVTQVVRGTAAESAGLKAGIRLSTVDGVRIRTQEDAIQALKSAGQDVSLGISLETTAPAMRQEGIVAGVQTATQMSARRSRRPGGRETSMPPFGCAEETVSVRKPTGLGPPGLGPQLLDWGEDGASRLRFKKSVDGNDPFKPNLYVPELAGSQQRIHKGNKTSYEVADEKGETDADGTWSMKKELMRTGKQQTNKEAIERRNGDIITDLNNAGFVETPRRGKDRAASPMATRLPASGAPKGFEQKQQTGRRCNAESYRAESELLHFNPSGTGTPTTSQRRTMTPGRYRYSPHDSGDFIGGRGFDPKPPAKTGIRSVPHVYDLPQPVPKEFRPTPRHQVSTPSPSDIFNVCGYRGDCKDVRDQERSRSARGVSPRNFSSIDLAHNPRRDQYEPVSTPRKGKASGSMVPPRPQAGYLPWGERE